MTTCPSCQQSVDEDFGMVTCPQCGHQFWVGSFADEEPVAQNETSEITPPAGEDLLYTLHADEPPAEAEPSVILEEEEEGYDPPVAMEGEGVLAEWEPDKGGETPFQQEEGLSGAEEVPQSEPKTFSEEITDFAESEGLSEGAYEYRLRIRGLDPQDIFQNLRQVLEDVGLASSDLKRSAQDEVLVDWVGAVTAHRLVRRIRPMGLLVSWEQRHALKESD